MAKIGVYTGKKRNLIELEVDGFDPATVTGSVSVVQNGETIGSHANASSKSLKTIDIVLQEIVDKGPIDVIVSDKLLNEHGRPVFDKGVVVGTIMKVT